MTNRLKPFDVMKHFDNPEVMRTYIEETRAEIEKLRVEIAEWRSRYEAERKDHHASLKAWDEERSGQ